MEPVPEVEHGSSSGQLGEDQSSAGSYVMRFSLWRPRSRLEPTKSVTGLTKSYLELASRLSYSLAGPVKRC